MRGSAGRSSFGISARHSQEPLAWYRATVFVYLSWLTFLVKASLCPFFWLSPIFFTHSIPSSAAWNTGAQQSIVDEMFGVRFRTQMTCIEAPEVRINVGLVMGFWECLCTYVEMTILWAAAKERGLSYALSFSLSFSPLSLSLSLVLSFFLSLMIILQILHIDFSKGYEHKRGDCIAAVLPYWKGSGSGRRSDRELFFVILFLFYLLDVFSPSIRLLYSLALFLIFPLLH